MRTKNARFVQIPFNKLVTMTNHRAEAEKNIIIIDETGIYPFPETINVKMKDNMQSGSVIQNE
jgi:hypothetical protein